MITGIALANFCLSVHNRAAHSSEFSDYVLLGKNGKPIAVVEAKKSSTDAEIGREQAKQ